MKEKTDRHHETLERYCHVIGRNTTVMHSTDGTNSRYVCMNREKCDKNGGCTNDRFSSEASDKRIL